MISQNTIDLVYETIDVVEIVNEFVRLKKNGTNYKACCPFHDEKTPSFVVSETKQIYKCFGCGKAGDVVKFLMDHECLNYPEAIEWLCNYYNIPFEQESTEEEQTNQRIVSNIYSVNELASNLFYKNGTTYWEKRGYTQETIKKFNLGTSNNNIKSLNLDNNVLQEACLLSTKTNNDFFGSRAMVPIYTLSGKICGFGGRILVDNKKLPKYINTPNNPVYNKSLIVYGLYHSKKKISLKDECYVVEGYTDVISMHQNGIKNVISSSGTSFTEGQLKMIGRFTKNITFLMDGDEAGLKSIEKGIILALKEDFNVRVVILPNGEDPDTMATKNTLKPFIDKNKVDFLIYKTRTNKSNYETNPSLRTKQIKEIVELLRLIPDAINQMVYIDSAAKLLSIDKAKFSDYVLKGVTRKSVKKEVIKSTVNTHIEELARVMIEYGHFEVKEGIRMIELIKRELGPFYNTNHELINKIQEKYFEMELSSEYQGKEWFINNIEECASILLNHSNVNFKKINKWEDDKLYVIRDIKEIIKIYLRIELSNKLSEIELTTEEDLLEFNEINDKLKELQ